MSKAGAENTQSQHALELPPIDQTRGMALALNNDSHDSSVELPNQKPLRTIGNGSKIVKRQKSPGLDKFKIGKLEALKFKMQL